MTKPPSANQPEAGVSEAETATPQPETRDRKSRSRRRTYRSAAERKQQILHAAREAFSGSSLHGVSTRDIARAADINPATLFEIFGTKEALFREAVIAPLFKELREMRRRVSVYQAASQEISLELAEAGVERQIGMMTRLFPLFTTALFSDIEIGRELYRDQFLPLIEERTKMMLGLARTEVDPYFLELSAVGILFFLAMDETFGDGRLDRAAAATQLVRLITSGTAPLPKRPVAHPDPGSPSDLRDLRQLGSSALHVSPLALGFSGGFAADSSPLVGNIQEIFDYYVSCGGNFVEIGAGPREDEFDALIGCLIRDRRDGLVVASTHSVSSVNDRPSSGLTFRRRLTQTVEAQLKRAGIDCLDLLYVTGFAPGERAAEVVDACDDLIGEGKIRHAGFTDLPAWQAARIHAIAEAHGKKPFVAVRSGCGDVARMAERDLFPMALEMNMGIVGMAEIDSTVSETDEPSLSALRATVRAIAEERGTEAWKVELSWKLCQAGVIAHTIRPRAVEELAAALQALRIVLESAQIKRLNEAAVSDRLVGAPRRH